MPTAKTRYPTGPKNASFIALIRRPVASLVVAASLSCAALAAEKPIKSVKPVAGQDSQDSIDRFFQNKQSQDAEFERISRDIDSVFLAIEQQINQAFEQAEREIAGIWGDDSLMPERTRWVGYSDDLADRVIVDYEAGSITVQSVKDQSPEHLRKVLEEVLARSPEQLSDIDPIGRKLKEQQRASKDPFADDSFFDSFGFGDKKDKKPKTGGDMFAGELAVLIERKTLVVETYSRPAPAENAFDAPRSSNRDNGQYQAPQKPKKLPPKRPSYKPQQPKRQLSVKFGDDWHSRNAEKFAAQVFGMAKRYNLAPSIIFAIIHTESSFNPRARSKVPAYGLMQLVPTSGGLDAWKALGRGDKPPTSDFLYDPDMNIELGATYMDILMTRYLRRITDYQNRLYSSISAYNTGAGNVMRSFGRGTTIKDGSARINTMSSDALYQHLRANLPYEETRNYIRKVTEYRQYYTRYDR